MQKLALYVHMIHGNGEGCLLVVYNKPKGDVLMSMVIKDRTWLQKWKAKRNGWTLTTSWSSRSTELLTHPMVFEGKWPELRDLIKAEEAMQLIKKEQLNGSIENITI